VEAATRDKRTLKFPGQQTRKAPDGRAQVGAHRTHQIGVRRGVVAFTGNDRLRRFAQAPPRRRPQVPSVGSGLGAPRRHPRANLSGKQGGARFGSPCGGERARSFACANNDLLVQIRCTAPFGRKFHQFV